MSALMELQGVTKAFRAEPPVTPLEDLSLVVREGEVACISGVSGKGKSTLLNVMGGLLTPDAGTVTFLGQDVYALSPSMRDALHRQGIGFVFQTPYLVQALTAHENMEFAMRARKVPVNEGLIDGMLEEFGLSDRADHLPGELSVGQRRRLVIAQALLFDHRLILADEPTNDLDDAWSQRVYDRFDAFSRREGHAVVIVTHDQAYARRADVTYLLEEGRLLLAGGRGAAPGGEQAC